MSPMPRRRSHVRLALAAAMILVAAASATAARRPAQPSRDAVAARKVFDGFLRVSLEQPGWVPLDTTFEAMGIGCGERDGRPERTLWMARFHVLSVSVRGDRGTGVVDVLAAAEQAGSSFPVRRVAHHVLRFPLRQIRPHDWRVCSVSESGWRLGPGVVLHPAFDAELDAIYAIVDSIRGVPHRRWFDFPH